jgi:hypothetical protein
MTITLIFATMFCSLIAGVSLLGGSLARIDLPFLRNGGLLLVTIVDRLILRPVLAIGGVQTSRWSVGTKTTACIVLGITTLVLTIVFGELASRRGP